MASEGSKVLWKYAKKYSPYILLAIAFSVGQNYLNLQLPKLLGNLVDSATLSPTGDFSFTDVEIDQQTIINLFKTLILIFLVGGIFGAFRIITSQYIGTNVVYGIRSDMYAALQKQSYKFYDKNRTGDIISKATRDVSVSRNFLANQLANMIRDIFTLFILLYEVFRINWKLSLIFLSLVPILFGLMVWYRKNMYDNYINMSKKSGVLTSTLEENITGFRVVKAFAREKHELAKFKEDNDVFLNANLKIAKLTSTYGPSQEYITQVGSVLVLFIGARLVIQGQMTPGSVIEFYVYFALLYDPIRGIVNRFFQYSQVQGSLARINSVLKNTSEITLAEEPIEIKDIKGKYEFKDMWFSYDEDENYALKDINLEVHPGESLAIIGATGSGKSTFINLIPRFYDPTKGVIQLDGIDLKKLSIEDYRRKIGIVSQDIFLFSRTIRENITYGLERDVTDEEIERVAKIASIHNFIVSLPKGYKTMVGERGQTLSGGQKQRIAIARALLLNPKVLILDDSLSAVDIDTETHIQNALDQLFANTTTFIITQRISTIKNCDRIMVLDYGEIVELGTHDNLYELGGIYTKIYETMFKASTKRKERAEKRKEKVVELPHAEILDFEDVGVEINEDIEALREIYKEQYPNEEELEEQLDKIMKRIEKRQSKSDKKILRRKKNQYMVKVIKELKRKRIVEIQELATRFYVSPESLEEALEKWQKDIPCEIEKGVVRVADPETFNEQATEILKEIKEEMREEKKKKALKEERKLLKEGKEYYMRQIIDGLQKENKIPIAELAESFEVHEEALLKRLRYWKRKLPVEIGEDFIKVEDRKEFELAARDLIAEWEEEKKQAEEKKEAEEKAKKELKEPEGVTGPVARIELSQMLEDEEKNKREDKDK